MKLAGLADVNNPMNERLLRRDEEQDIARRLGRHISPPTSSSFKQKYLYVQQYIKLLGHLNPVQLRLAT